MSTQRKAWNEAMKKAARGSMLPVSEPVNRRSGRSSNNKRREKARRALNILGGDDENGAGGNGGGTIDLVEFRIDALEDAPSDLMNTGGDDDEEYDELEDFEDGSSSKKKRKTKSRKSTKAEKSGNVPKRFKARTLASILIEESTRGAQNGVLQQYLDAEAVRPSNSKPPYPKRKFCSVTGLYALYKDPKSNIPYANLTALEQIRERPPPWITGLNNTSSATYYETMRSLKGNEDT